MSKPTPRAGGFFITFAILAGLAIGAATGRAMLGVVAGAGAGIAAAILLWLADRSRR